MGFFLKKNNKMKVSYNKRKKSITKSELLKRTNEVEKIYLALLEELGDTIEIGVDRITLTLLAQAINMVNACDDVINKNGVSESSAEVAVRREAARTIIQLSNRFGLSPKDRILMNKDSAKMSVVDEAGDDL